MIRIRPTLEELKQTGGDYDYYPVSGSLLADVKTPIQTLRTLSAAGSKCFLLESVEGGEKWSRYSFIGVDPVAEIISDDGVVSVTEKGRTESKKREIAVVLRDMLSRCRSARFDFLPPLTAGLVGYFSYDYGAALSGVQNVGRSPDGAHDVHLMLFDKIVAYDHFRQTITVMAGVPAGDLDAGYKAAAHQIERICRLIKSPQPPADPPLKLGPEQPVEPDKRRFSQWVEEVKNAVREGEVFQAVPSLVRRRKIEGSLLGCYRRLRASNPSPYMFYLDCGDLEICGASPETLIRKQGDLLSTFPIAGSAPRGDTDESDSENERALLKSEKELAEHNMLVDLGRNDLGKVSRLGSVKVSDYCKVMRFSHIMHLTTTVTGQAAEGTDALKALSALLPAGTLSGAPKKRAMQLISSLEGQKRGVYGGAVGYIDLTGNMDMCIGIRTAVRRGDEVMVRSGCGVVAESDPEREYDECAYKAAAVMKALEAAAGEEE